MMDFFQLETFLAVAQTGSFSAAAAQVHRTQPAVSQIVRKLEEEVGEPLFDRSSRDGTLTDACVHGGVAAISTRHPGHRRQ
jgi:DNA-binding transcriptional LysR family regulator